MGFLFNLLKNKKALHENEGLFKRKAADRGLCPTRRTYKKIKPCFFKQGFTKERRRHTLPQDCSTICAGGLNFSVRDGKR